MGMFFICAFAYRVRLAIRVVLVYRFVGGVQGWSFGEGCGDVQKLRVLGKMVLEFQ